MDRNEYSDELNDMKKMVEKGEYEAAHMAAEDIDWKKVKSNPMLVLGARVYEAAKDYARAKELLSMAYERTPLGRQLAYQLCLISIKTNEIDEAKEYYLDFADMAPNDSGRVVLEYQLAKANNATVSKLIELLKPYVDEEMDEKWTYELAKLYAKNGDRANCVKLCDQLSLWFNNGKYVVKALGLKKQLEPLTESQQDIYDKAMEDAAAEAAKKAKEEEMLKAADKSSTKIFDAKEEQRLKDLLKRKDEEKNSQINKELDFDSLESKTVEAVKNQEMEMQEELAHNLQQIMDEDEEVVLPNTAKLDEAIAMARALSDVKDTVETDNSSDDNGAELELEPIDDILEETGFSENDIKERFQKTIEDDTFDNVFETKGNPIENSLNQKKNTENETSDEEASDQDVSIEYETSAEIKNAPEIDGTLKVEGDGQLGLDIPEEPMVEKQITGQLSLNEILKDLETRGILNKDTVNGAIDVVNENTGVLPKISNEPEFLTPEQMEDVLSQTQVGLDIDNTGNVSLQQPEKIVQLNENLEEIGTINNNSIQAESGDIIEVGVEAMMSDEELAELEFKKKQQREMFKKDEPVDEIDEVLKLVENLENKKKEEPKETKPEDFDIPDTPETGRYYLSEENKKIFEGFLNVTGLENSLAETLYNLKEKYDRDGTSKANNVVIIGEMKSGRTTLAADIIKTANRDRNRHGRKTAKINGNNINKKGILSVMPRLLGSDVIIENAGLINATMVRQMVNAFSGYTDEMIVILEDNKSNIERLFETHPVLFDMFSNRIVIKQYDINEWVAYAKAYVREFGYTVDDMGTLALYARIDEEYGRNRGLEKEDVEEIMNIAMDRSDGKGIGKLFGKMFKKKSGELIVLKETFFDA